ncbi:SDR family NAD(P)-dependent oxidoreductase [Frankia sp. Cr2]|uniref:SDR family NAD(P)-dependent oxidoreductase n=1 Tax=Frankia sp. Cr2 TaxID=3073932 RepID=UPI002AD39D4D|nr:SDR family NAD(P)-dependent oxidoreductase [Frankia sp. Cr2]
MPVALVTGASRGLGRATARALATRGWSLVIDARGADALQAVARELTAAVTRPNVTRPDVTRPDVTVTTIPGDVADPRHRTALAAAVHQHGRLDLLVNNASVLGPSPQPELADYPSDELARVYEVNVFAPLALAQLMLPLLADGAGTIVNVSSDAAVEAYPGWGGYGSAKAALDQLTAVLAVERPSLRAYSFDPGDMRTQLQQEAFPGEDISDRPAPETVLPALLRLVDERPASGRYRVGDTAMSDTAVVGRAARPVS